MHVTLNDTKYVHIFFWKHIKILHEFWEFWAAKLHTYLHFCNYRFNTEFCFPLITSKSCRGNESEKNIPLLLDHDYTNWIRIFFLDSALSGACETREREISVASKRNGSLIKTKTWMLAPKIGRTIDDGTMKLRISVSLKENKRRSATTKGFGIAKEQHKLFRCIRISFAFITF